MVGRDSVTRQWNRSQSPDSLSSDMKGETRNVNLHSNGAEHEGGFSTPISSQEREEGKGIVVKPNRRTRNAFTR